MKKLLVAALAVLSLSAFADTSLNYSDGLQKDQDGGALTRVEFFDLKTSLTKDLAGDLMIINKTRETTNALTNRTELGLNYSGPFGAFARVSAGEKEASGATSVAYYTVEPGVGVTVGKFDAKVSYYLRETFHNTDSDAVSTARYSVGYKLTDKDTISLGVYHDFRGNIALTDTKWIGYTRSF
jgi:hypothetical protein